MEGCCGLNEKECGLYRQTDPQKRVATVKAWAEKTEDPVKKAKLLELCLDINALICEGCNSRVVFWGCAICLIRTCCQEKGFSSCRECPEKPCKKLRQLHEKMPEAKTNIID